MPNIQDAILTPVLDEFESTASLNGRVEKLSANEFELLSQLLRYPEEAISRESLKRTIGSEDGKLSNRRLDAAMNTLIRKIFVLHTEFALVRFVPSDSYMYTLSLIHI